jgi:hypothetical protein
MHSLSCLEGGDSGATWGAPQSHDSSIHKETRSGIQCHLFLFLRQGALKNYFLRRGPAQYTVRHRSKFSRSNRTLRKELSRCDRRSDEAFVDKGLGPVLRRPTNMISCTFLRRDLWEGKLYLLKRRPTWRCFHCSRVMATSTVGGGAIGTFVGAIATTTGRPNPYSLSAIVEDRRGKMYPNRDVYVECRKEENPLFPSFGREARRKLSQTPAP